MNRYELEERLINFSILVYQLTNALPRSKEGLYYKDQIIRSSTSSALNYGEAISAESGKDFLHKSRLVLKELRETFVALRIIEGTQIIKSSYELERALKENNELIAIFVKTIQTSLKNQKSNPNR
jgi:four helix bundle protein